MICRYCGSELPEGAKNCPNCGEPVAVKREKPEKHKKSIEQQQLEKKQSLAMVSIPTLTLAGVLMFCCPIASLILLVIWGIIFVCVLKSANAKEGSKEYAKYVIMEQYEKDHTSICPRCGSHNIKTYRQGYNYNGAFWGNMLDLKGSRYIAGMDSNHLRCRCGNCGHDWDSGYDSRLTK